MTHISSRAGSFGKTMRRALLTACALGCFGGIFVVPAGAAERTYLQISEAAYGANQSITIGINKSLILDLPADAREVIVSQPNVANAIMRSKRRAIIQGIAPGGTNIFFLDASGQAISVIDVSVGDNAGNLVAALKSILPTSDIQVASFGDTGVVLSGTVDSGDDLQKALDIAARFAGDPEHVANAISVSGSQQIMLKVTVAEVSRDTVKQMGINLTGALTVGNFNLGFNSTQTGLTNGINGGIIQNGLSLSAELRALEQRGALRTLAEPTLTAISGQPAEFLAGGQIPILSSIDDGTRTFTMKDFGVKLKFTPTVKSNGIIGLAIDTEYSEVSESGFEVGGETIPGFNSRRATTAVELRAGETVAIAGMLQDNVRQQISGLPGLGNIPILGALFRSREFQRRQTELVILVTPYVAEVDGPVALPTDAYEVSTDAEAVFLGQMEKNYGVGQSHFRGGYDGSVGFVLD